jgi:hypothetical protein
VAEGERGRKINNECVNGSDIPTLPMSLYVSSVAAPSLQFSYIMLLKFNNLNCVEISFRNEINTWINLGTFVTLFNY